MKQDFSGKWTGKLTYGSNFGHLEHEALFFIMEIEQQGDELAGVSRDIDGIGMSSCETSITGFLDNGQINFAGEYKLPVLSGRNAGAQVLQDQSGSEVSFSGTYNPQTDEFEGEWIILSGYVLYNHLFFENDNGGSWSMKRE